MRTYGWMLLLILLLHGGLASSRALSDAETATLRTPSDYSSLQGRARYALAESLGKERNVDALPLLIELRDGRLMGGFVQAYQLHGVVDSTPAMETMALALARDSSYERDETSWYTRFEFFRLLRHYQSRELFDLIYESTQRELNARRNGDRSSLPRSQRSIGGSLLSARVPNLEEQVAALIPLMIDSSQGYSYFPFLRQRHYLAAFDRLRDFYARMGMSTAGCDDEVTWTMAMFQTPAASQAIIQRARWLLDQPENAGRNAELEHAVGSMGRRRVEAQVDLDALSREIFDRPMSPGLHDRLTDVFKNVSADARRAGTFDTDNLLQWVSEDQVEIVRSFIEHGVNPNVASRRAEAPLVLAAQLGNLEMVKALVEGGADVNLTDGSGMPPLLCVSGPAPRGPDAADLAAYLLAHGAHLEATDNFGLSALHLAARGGNTAVIDVLLAGGARIDVKKKRGAFSQGEPDLYAGASPLHVAASESKTETAEHLVARGADVNARTADGSTPLLLAVSFKNPTLARFLIEHGANVNLSAHGGLTPVVMAHENADQATEALLLSKGAFLNPITLASRAAIEAFMNAVGSGMK